MIRPLPTLALGLALLLPTAIARAQEETGAPPKVAVVTIGDADDALREAAHGIDRALQSDPQLLTPADPDLRRALRGEPPEEEDDGLERARRTRRALGMGEARDTPGLTALGRMAGAVAVVAVRRRGAAIEAVVFDVGRGAFFEGAMRLPEARAEEVGRFVGGRARAAARRAATAEPAEAEHGSEVVEAEAQDRSRQGQEPVVTPARPGDDPPQADEEESEPSWLEEGWPLIVAGILLAGALVYFLVPESPAASGPPVLRFIPGGE